MSKRIERLNNVQENFCKAFYYALEHKMYNDAARSFLDALLEFEIYKNELKAKSADTEYVFKDFGSQG